MPVRTPGGGAARRSTGKSRLRVSPLLILEPPAMKLIFAQSALLLLSLLGFSAASTANGEEASKPGAPWKLLFFWQRGHRRHLGQAPFRRDAGAARSRRRGPGVRLRRMFSARGRFVGGVWAATDRGCVWQRPDNAGHGLEACSGDDSRRRNVRRPAATPFGITTVPT